MEEHFLWSHVIHDAIKDGISDRAKIVAKNSAALLRRK